eukprot:3940503-Rhodomonas_salina.4
MARSSGASALQRLVKSSSPLRPSSSSLPPRPSSFSPLRPCSVSAPHHLVQHPHRPTPHAFQLRPLHHAVSSPLPFSYRAMSGDASPAKTKKEDKVLSDAIAQRHPVLTLRVPLPGAAGCALRQLLDRSVLGSEARGLREGRMNSGLSADAMCILATASGAPSVLRDVQYGDSHSMCGTDWARRYMRLHSAMCGIGIASGPMLAPCDVWS